MFPVYLAIGLVVLLGLAFVLSRRSERKGTRRGRYISTQISDPGVNAARASAFRNFIGGPPGGR